MKNLRSELHALSCSRKAILAFNMQSLNQLQMLSVYSEQADLPVIAQFSEKYYTYFENLIGMPALIERYQRGRVYFHLDHARDLTAVKACADLGFSSVMFDGSRLPIEQNAEIAKNLYAYAHERDTLLEVEVGVVGGVEDGAGADDHRYFNQTDLKFFADHGGFDLLALGIGTAHGMYTDLSSVDIELLSTAKDIVNGDPMFVLHGGTGLPEEMIRKAIAYGVVKVNISTGLKMQTQRSIKEFSMKNDKHDEAAFQEYLQAGFASFFASYMTTYTR